MSKSLILRLHKNHQQIGFLSAYLISSPECSLQDNLLQHSYNQTQLLLLFLFWPFFHLSPNCPAVQTRSCGPIFKAIIVIYRLIYLLNCILFYFTLIPCAENPSECAAGTAEGWGLTPGKSLRHGHDQGLCRKGIVPMNNNTAGAVAVIKPLVVNWFALF